MAVPNIASSNALASATNRVWNPTTNAFHLLWAVDAYNGRNLWEFPLPNVLQAYNAVCRATGRLTEATVTGVVLGVVACGAAAATADQGATTMAVAWVGSFAAGAIWCGLRTLRITSAPAPSHLSLLTAPGAAPSVAGAD